MFSYINIYGKYPPGLFANQCKEGKEGLDCNQVKPTNSSNSNTAHVPAPHSMLLMATAGFLGLLLHLFWRLKIMWKPSCINWIKLLELSYQAFWVRVHFHVMLGFIFLNSDQDCPEKYILLQFTLFFVLIFLIDAYKIVFMAIYVTFVIVFCTL